MSTSPPLIKNLEEISQENSDSKVSDSATGVCQGRQYTQPDSLISLPMSIKTTIIANKKIDTDNCKRKNTAQSLKERQIKIGNKNNRSSSASDFLDKSQQSC